ncbi:MAG: O-antigen ligase family protein [Thermoanaerobaculales bacterium]|nr:O-antigen ligase family protein [Thermoanaerobaculales bacterium]
MATQANSIEKISSLEVYLGWLAIVLAAALPLYRPWVTLASTAILVFWLIGGGLSLRAGRLRSHRLTLAVLFFIALNLVSLVWTSDPGDGLRYVAKYRYLLLVPMVATCVGPMYRRFAVTAFELAAGASVVLSIGILVGMYRLRDAHPGDPSPTMAHLDFGLLLALATLMILARVLYSEMSAGHTVLWTLLGMLTTFGLMVNIGSAGHLAFAGGLVVLLIHWAKGRPARLVIGVGIGFALTLLLVWFVFPKFQTRVGEAQTELRNAVVAERYDSNLGGRVAAMKVAREIFREDPFLGTGVGGNIPAFRRALDTRFKELKPSIYWYPHFHNQYVQIATELGIAGLLALAWIFWELIRAPRKRRETDAAALILATVYLLGFLGEPFFHKQITLVMFALFAGVISAEQLDEDSANEES